MGANLLSKSDSVAKPPTGRKLEKASKAKKKAKKALKKAEKKKAKEVSKILKASDKIAGANSKLKKSKGRQNPKHCPCPAPHKCYCHHPPKHLERKHPFRV